MTLTKEAVVESIREKIGFPAKEAREVVEMVLEEIKSKLEKGEYVKVSGFGKWAVKDKKARRGRNPHTGDAMEISARRVVAFYPSDKLRLSVNQAAGFSEGSAESNGDVGQVG